MNRPNPISREEIQRLYDRPLLDLVFDAASVHRAFHDPSKIQRSALMSVKTGGCIEDCGYCSQSSKSETRMDPTAIATIEEVVAQAQKAKEAGATRFCMGAAWRKLPNHKLPEIKRMVIEVKRLGLETCLTLGTISKTQAEHLKSVGLDYYNHNIDTSREHYPNVVTTRSYDERLNTLRDARSAGLKLCSGGILGIGEKTRDRIGFLLELAKMNPPPESIPINTLVPIEGTQLAASSRVDWSDIVRMIATARLVCPTSILRLSAGRESMSEEMQAWCFLAGANSIFSGDTLLTTPNQSVDADSILLSKLGLAGA